MTEREALAYWANLKPRQQADLGSELLVAAEAHLVAETAQNMGCEADVIRDLTWRAENADSYLVVAVRGALVLTAHVEVEPPPGGGVDPVAGPTIHRTITGLRARSPTRRATAANDPPQSPEDRTMRQTIFDRATSAIETQADDAERVISRAIAESSRSDLPNMRGRRVTQALAAAGFEIRLAGDVTDILDLRAGHFIQDGRVDQYEESLVTDWIAVMEELPLDPATHPTGQDVAIVALMPDGRRIPMTQDEFTTRAQHQVSTAVTPTDPRAQAVIDIVEAKRLIASAEAVIGEEAVDELLN
ncbi:hypothetical protein [Methylobacterium sp. J-067]|uniref:hypothetical protein n=1 Tax=Methylobacterium sp. J-067 TaxID=2836648 RepID=UPI001FBA71AF|nr:hypothetical protein [Methylobacterium sp. J-067]MCJ2024765.1 hypothetical protein [Methylobacterium sp. J-067]